MRIVYFTHSLASCWNHGNVHFLRGLLRELKRRGHSVTACEPADGWSRHNLVADHGDLPLRRFHAAFPDLDVCVYRSFSDFDDKLHNADVVIVHEWNDPALVAGLGDMNGRGGQFVLLFHDTHHRAVSEPASLGRCELGHYDGVLAFGQSLAEVYRRRGWGRRVFVFHEAADTSLFRPPAENERDRNGLAWIGNWGDDERGEELAAFLLRPARDLGLAVDIYGVRYPAAALNTLASHGASYRGWLANVDVPRVLSGYTMTVHVPRRFYAARLTGIPTIRVFEALACGIPLITAPWQDCEGLFRPGLDYLVAEDEAGMRKHMYAVAGDPELRRSLIRHGLQSILARHTCGHRADQLEGIVAGLGQNLERVA